MDSTDIVLPVFCPKCHAPVAIVVDAEAPLKDEQLWRCPHCASPNLAQFDGKITMTTPRDPLPAERIPDMIDGASA